MPAILTRRLAPRSRLSRVAQAVGLCCILAAGPAPASAKQPFVTTKGDLKRQIWYLIAEFHPLTTEVRGIPVNKIRSNWCKATEYRKDLIPKALLVERGVDSMAANKVSFAVEGHFDGTATRQVALVGVYQECAGQKGRFLLVLDQPSNGQQPKVRFLNAVRTAHQFGALSVVDNAIVEWTCMECDNISMLKWNPRKRGFAWVTGGY